MYPPWYESEFTSHGKMLCTHIGIDNVCACRVDLCESIFISAYKRSGCVYTISALDLHGSNLSMHNRVDPWVDPFRNHMYIHIDVDPVCKFYVS